MRYVCVSLLSVYFGAGLFGGLLMKQAIPAINPLGVAYYAATWPGHVYCASTVRDCDSFPGPRVSKYFFTFDKQEDK